MRGRGHRREYGWPQVQTDLAEGVHPAVVALRLGESLDYVLEVATDRQWPIQWDGDFSPLELQS